MPPEIAVVGMACRYPDAKSPLELWENALAQRRAFRRMPGERLRLEDYLSPDLNAEDRTYVGEAALIEGYDFDRVRYRVAGSTYRSADLTHWLALDIASQALEDAGFNDGEGLPRHTTGVVLGNTLTGEFSRANLMRLRWPYVRRVVEAQLADEGWAAQQRHDFLDALETRYKVPFPPVGEETLAGGLSNTIAGRVCNHFDLKGGGYTVDGACASSLLAIITACRSLAASDLDVALAGGVDLSLDPFEMVGFAKTRALAPDEMRIYDARSAGFWPGEGCGFVVLMRHEDALAAGRKVYAVIHGWGVSSDGSGGITRPEVSGQLLALQRAYRGTGFGIGEVAYFEGHGTGTSVGDATELQALSNARREASPNAPPAAIGSIKANIGHTKAAAGVAGLIKASMALQAQVLPPTTGCEQPHPILAGEAPTLRVLSEGEPWPQDRPLRAGVSAMGFGGINTHLVLEGASPKPRRGLSSRDRGLLASQQDAELFLFSAPDAEALARKLEHLRTIARRLSRAELGDLAAELERTLIDDHVRAAIVASSPEELAAGIDALISQITAGVTAWMDTRAGLFMGNGHSRPRIAFLFPGQGSPAHLSGGIWRRRFDFVREIYAWSNLPSHGDGIATEIAQPAIVTASLVALHVLERLDIHASVGVGHSLGELTALYWGGAIDKEALLRIATARGRAVAELGSSTGAMASISAGQREVERLLDGDVVGVAGLNSPRQTVISGEGHAVSAVVARAQARGLTAVRLPVSHAFHSPLVASAAPALAVQVAQERFGPLERTVISTVTGAQLATTEDLRLLLCRQVTEPVHFLEAASMATREADLLIEVGPGRVLSNLVADFVDTPSVPAIALDAGGPSLRGLLQAAGAVFALGSSINHAVLFAGRFTRPFSLDWHPRFFANPCELAPIVATEVKEQGVAPPMHEHRPSEEAEIGVEGGTTHVGVEATSPLDVVRQLVAERAELPVGAVKDGNRLLSDLHLNSIAVGKLVADAARHLGLLPPIAPNEFADATVADVAQALQELARTGASTQAGNATQLPPGVDSWIRAFTVELVERPLGPLPRHLKDRRTGGDKDRRSWEVIAPAGHSLAGLLQQALASLGGGVVVCLPPCPDERHLSLLLEGARAVLRRREGRGAREEDFFLLVQHGGGAASFARTLYLEAPAVTTCVVDLPVDHPKNVEWALAEIQAAKEGGYSEAHYDAEGRRWEPRLRLLEIEDAPAVNQYLGPDDVLLVTGGGKGIAAECALDVAQRTGVRLALMGRSWPDNDCELAANLERMAAKGVKLKYLSADVTDEEAVRRAVQEVEAEFGRVTAILHGAGSNKPQLLSSLDEATFLETLAPKVQGARNVLGAVGADHLKLFVSFGSIIARTGMRGEADYGLANEWLARLTGEWQAEHPHCRCLAVEWSVWSGVGMGERLGRIESLVQAGITPIPPGEGVAILSKLIAQPLPAASIVVAGRFGQPPTLKMEQPDLPFLRFLEQSRVYYPGIELVIDADLSFDADPYLQDHVYRGDALLPAVMGLEAMAEAVQALTGCTSLPSFHDVEFNRPIVVNGSSPLKVRIATLARTPGTIDVALRSEETGFQVDHFRATCHLEDSGLPASEFVEGEPTATARAELSSEVASEEGYLPLDPERHLYGPILFHTGRFRRLRGYKELRAKECLADIEPGPQADWFGRYFPPELALGDPGMRDAAIHAVQACIPHATLLPVRVDKLTICETQASCLQSVHARELSRDGDTFVYDLEVTGKDGRLVERWVRLHLRRVDDKELPEPCAAPLLATYLERRMEELVPGTSLSVVIHQDKKLERSVRRDRAVRRIFGPAAAIIRRPDGKPEVANAEGKSISVSHSEDMTLVVAGQGETGCDIEVVQARSASQWQDLLGPERFALAGIVAKEKLESKDASATRVWAASECLSKVGAVVNAPLTLHSIPADGWVLLSSGRYAIATYATRIEGAGERVAVAMLACPGREG